MLGVVLGLWLEAQAASRAQAQARERAAYQRAQAQKLAWRFHWLAQPRPLLLGQLVALGLRPLLRKRPRELKYVAPTPRPAPARPVRRSRASKKHPGLPLTLADLASYGPPRTRYAATPLTPEQLATYGPLRTRYAGAPATSLEPKLRMAKKKTLYPGGLPKPLPITPAGGPAKPAPVAGPKLGKRATPVVPVRRKRRRNKAKIWSFPHVW